MKPYLIILLISFIYSANTFGQGMVRGKLTDEKGETIIGATIVLKSNRSIGTVTDFDGNYSLKLPDSNPQIVVISSIGFKEIEENIKVEQGGVLVKNFVLLSSSLEISEVQVVAKAVKSKDYYIEQIKKNSTTTIDYISSETMKKTGDNNIVSAVARIPGVSTSGGFITVRGIGDRYVKTALNGSQIPTLDPFTNNIKLDLFPSSLVDNITLTKTASPDLPGDWAGAFLSVETKDYPEKLSLLLETSFTYNNQTSFKNVLTSEGSSTDWLGFDNGYREYDHESFAPVYVSPNQYQEFTSLGLGDFYQSMGVNASTPWNETYTKLGLVELGFLGKAELNNQNAYESAMKQYQQSGLKNQAFFKINERGVNSAKQFQNNWNTYEKQAPLGFRQNISLGNQASLFGKTLGYVFGLRYGSNILYDPNSSTNEAAVDVDDNVFISSSTQQKASRQVSGFSFLLNTSYKLNSNNSISLLFMPNFSGQSNVRDAIDEGTSQTYKYILDKNQYYEEREQLIYQFKSEHYIPASKLKIESFASYTDGKSDVPDFKYLRYFSNDDLQYLIDTKESDTHRYYRYLSEKLFDSHLNFELPVDNSTALRRVIRFGGAYQNNKRTYDQYDYRVIYNDDDFVVENNDFDEFFSQDEFGFNTSLTTGSTAINKYYTQANNPSNHTIGENQIYAGFVMIDYSLDPLLRLSGGLRIEHANTFTDVMEYDLLGYKKNDPRRQFAGEIFTVNPGELNETSFLPSINALYKLHDDESKSLNLRASYGRTVARPSMRELSDIVVYDYELREDVFGNSELKMVGIDNYDLRLENYFKTGEYASVSLFYKDFKNHIELVYSNQGYTWQNVDKSYVGGVELEFKKKVLESLYLSANVTFVKSVSEFVQTTLLVDEGVKKYIPIDTVSRTMFGQSPYVLNGILSYSLDSIGLTLTASYNLQGEKLVLTSSNGAPDIYERPRHLLDFKVAKNLGKHFGISLTIQDILNTSVQRSYKYDGGNYLDYDKYSFGTSYQISVSYKL